MSGIVMRSDGFLYIHRVLVDEKFWPMFAKNSSWMLVHRYVVAKYLGRCLLDNEEVRHIDLDKLNNDIENLEIIPESSLDKEDEDFRDNKEVPKAQIAEMLGVARTTIYNWLETKRLKGQTIKDVIDFVREEERRITQEEIIELVKSYKEERD